MVAVHFLPELQYSGRYIQVNLSTNLQYYVDEKQLHLKQDQSRSNKSAIYPRIVTTLQHLLLMIKTKEGCMHVILMTTWLLDKSTSINCVACELKKSMPSDSQSQLQVTHKTTWQFTQWDSTRVIWCVSWVSSAIDYQRHVRALAPNTQAHLKYIS